MITNGTYVRGFPYNIETIDTLNNLNVATLSISFEKLFKSFDALLNLGMGIEYDNLDRPFVVIEHKVYFYQPHVILQLDTISDLVYLPDETFLFSKVDVGYDKFQNDNPYGMTEYNNKTTYSTPLIPFDKTLNITSTIRADGTGIEQLRTSQKTVDEAKELKLDNEIFVVCCHRSTADANGYVLTSLHDENTVLAGLVGSPEIEFNTDIVPAQMFNNWSDIVSVGLQHNLSDNIIFQHSKKPVNVATKNVNGDQPWRYENQDIPISSLKTPYLSGMKAQFNAPLGLIEIKAIETNRNGLVAFYDYTTQEYQFGWIKEVSTNPVDKTTTWELQMAVFSDTFAAQVVPPPNKIVRNLPTLPVVGYELAEDGAFCLAEDSTFILNEMQ